MPPSEEVERKRGNRLGFWFFLTLARFFGLRAAYGLLYFVALHYLLFDRPVVRASLAYTIRRFPGHGRLRQLFNVYLLFLNQGKSLIDRYAVSAGYDGIAIDIEGFERLKGFVEAGHGFILLTAHLGNWQAAMTALGGFGRTVHLMMRPEDNAAVKDNLRIYSEEERVRIIYADDSLNSVLEAMKALKKGDIVSIMGDRTYGFSSREATFLGGKVSFPYGAFSLASAVQCPLVVLLSAKTASNRYLVDVTNIIEPPSSLRGKKDEDIRGGLQQFADILQGYVADYPYQWFAFRDIWKSNE